MPHREVSPFPLVGAVLAGGASSRLGRDKAALRLDGETDLLSRTVALLRGVTATVIVIGRSHPGCASVPDLLPGRGPVGGIASALAHAAGAACLVLSCDLPFMTSEVLVRLVREYNARPAGALATVYRQKETGRPEHLVAVYGPEALPDFHHCMEEGLLKVGPALAESRKHFIDYTEAEALPFFNLNRPADLEEAVRILAERRGLRTVEQDARNEDSPPNAMYARQVE